MRWNLSRALREHREPLDERVQGELMKSNGKMISLITSVLVFVMIVFAAGLFLGYRWERICFYLLLFGLELSLVYDSLYKCRRGLIVYLHSGFISILLCCFLTGCIAMLILRLLGAPYAAVLLSIVIVGVITYLLFACAYSCYERETSQEEQETK